MTGAIFLDAGLSMNGSTLRNDGYLFTPDGTTNPRSIIVKARDIVDARDFGVAIDGTDQRAKLQAAIDATPLYANCTSRPRLPASR